MLTNADSRHYEFYITKAKAGGPAAPPEGDWTLLHVVAGPSTSNAGDQVLIVWSRPKPKKH